MKELSKMNDQTYQRDLGGRNMEKKMEKIQEKLSDLGYKNERRYHLHNSPSVKKEKNCRGN
ncbi:hypothetical protein ACQP3D_30085, partial [Escherichia coli]